MAARTYKKYMKQNVKKDYNLVKIFIVSFFVMLFVFTYIIKSFTPSVDVSIGDYKQETSTDGVKDLIIYVKTNNITKKETIKIFTKL